MELNELYYINGILMGFMNEETNLAAGNPQLHVIKDPEDNDGDNDNDTASSSCSSLLITRMLNDKNDVFNKSKDIQIWINNSTGDLIIQDEHEYLL
jgi:hypothetical protein